MILDDEVQRGMLLQLFDAVNFQGKDLDALYALKQAIRQASILPATEPAEDQQRDKPRHTSPLCPRE